MTTELFSKLVGDLYSGAANVRPNTDGFSRLMDGNSVAFEKSESEIFSSLSSSVDECKQWLSGYIERHNVCVGANEQNNLLALLEPHYCLARSIHNRYKKLNVMCDNLLDLLGHTQYGAILTTYAAQIIYANSIAEELLAKREILEVRGNELHARKCSNQAAIRNLIEVTGRGDAAGSKTGGSLAIRGDRPGRTFAVHVLPIGKDSPNNNNEPTLVLILIVNPDCDPVLRVETMCKLYGLTKAEATVAVQVTRGEGLKAVAKGLCVSLSTVRIHLQQVFEKTGTHRQAELVRQLLIVQAGIKVPAG